MPFMLKLQWDIKAGREASFRANQEALCRVMLEHPGVICYHADYPSPRVTQWTEIYATDEAFEAHLAQRERQGPPGCTRRRVRQDHLRMLGQPKRQIERNPRRLRDHVSRDGQRCFRPESHRG